MIAIPVISLRKKTQNKIKKLPLLYANGKVWVQADFFNEMNITRRKINQVVGRLNKYTENRKKV